jgi:hypothetical protein
MTDLVPRFLPGEAEAIETVKQLGAEHGYGNLISHLKDAWSEKLQAQGISKNGADTAAGHICAWCHMDRRTGEKKPPRRDRDDFTPAQIAAQDGRRNG